MELAISILKVAIRLLIPATTALLVATTEYRLERERDGHEEVQAILVFYMGVTAMLVLIASYDNPVATLFCVAIPVGATILLNRGEVFVEVIGGVLLAHLLSPLMAGHRMTGLDGWSIFIVVISLVAITAINVITVIREESTVDSSEDPSTTTEPTSEANHGTSDASTPVRAVEAEEGSEGDTQMNGYKNPFMIWTDIAGIVALAATIVLVVLL